jgi:Cu2+-exporting ATPase
MSTPAQVAQPVTSATHCFHCNEPLLGSTLTVRVDERNEPVCCQGCRAVAELIAATGLGDYYRFREVAGARPDSGAPRPNQWAALNRPEVAAQFVRHSRDDYAVLAVDGLRCSACSWLIDRVVKSLPGVQESTTNSATGRTFVSWRGAETLLGDICRKIAELGYRPHPLTADGAIDLQQDERRDALKRLAVAGFGMMQVMMFAVATYSADLAGEVLDPALFDFFRIVSLLVATPVLFYAAAPVFTAARRNFRTRTIGMDVPVAIALGLAYSASLWNTLRHTEAQVYFDSVTMFIFFLTLARFVQMSVRRRTIETTEALSRQLPSYAHRIERDTLSDVPLAALQPGDIVLVRPGEVLPADGELLDAEACIDEAMLSGESLPMSRRTGDRLSAGMLNAGNPLRLRVLAVAAGTALSHIASLQQRAQAQRPAMAKAADAAAARFLNYVLLGAGLTCAFWLSVNPSRAFETTLSVLVVACPCAFAIATPAAISAVAAHLARLGVLVTRIDAIEALARIDQVVFDKTGTLTHGDITVQRCIPLADLDETECLRIAAALELASEHPLARAFAGFGVRGQAIQLRAVPGAGLEGSVDGHRYRIGTRPFVMQLRGEPSQAAKDADVTGTAVVLGDERRELALFELHDTPRSSAATSIGVLRAMGIRTQIVSGDSRPAVASLAMQCGVSEYLSRYSPEQKLAHVQTLQARGHRVAMVGDGVNDAPVLAASDLSIAMGRGAALAHASADMLLMTENLDSLPRAIELARKAQRIARQNLFWSAVYNFGSLPLAAAGLVSPWIAALGMSLSSIAVVLNSARLLPARSRADLPTSAPGNLS